MNFVNNWRRQMALAQSAVSVPLELPDGEYVLTMSDALGQAATRWEYIRAIVASGIAELQRGEEGSADQDWPEGSWIGCSVTAGALNGISATFEAQGAQIAALNARVQLLEAMIPARLTVTVGGASDLAGYLSGVYGALKPDQIVVPGEGVFRLASAEFDTPSDPVFSLQFRGEFPPSRIVSVNVQGVGTLNVADGWSGNSEDGAGPVTMFTWVGLTTDWFGSIGQARVIEFTFAAD